MEEEDRILNERLDDLNNYKDCPLCGIEKSLFVDDLDEHNSEIEELIKLRAENERLREEIEKHKIAYNELSKALVRAQKAVR